MKENSKSSPLEGIGKVIPAILLMFVVIGVGLGGMRYLNSLKKAPVQATAAGTSASGEIVITLRGNGDIVLNAKVISMTELENRMKEIVTAFPDQAVIVRESTNADPELVSEALLRLKKAGAKITSLVLIQQ